MGKGQGELVSWCPYGLLMLEAALSQEEGSGYFELGPLLRPPTPTLWLA